MNEKVIIIDDEYIEFDYNALNGKQPLNGSMPEESNKLDDLENNFVQKCNLTNADYKRQDEQVEGDDEHETDEGDAQLNQANTPTTQRRRRKSSGRKLNKILQSSSHSSSNMSNSKLADTNTEDAPQSASSSTSLSSWIHLPNQQEPHFNQLSKNNMAKNLNSSYDTISEEEHRAKMKKRNLRSIDDDIVSSNVSSENDQPAGAENSEKHGKDKLDKHGKDKLDKKSTKSTKSTKQPSCDSLSSSPTNVSYDSSPVKSQANNSKLMNGKSTNLSHNPNKENQNAKHLCANKTQATSASQTNGFQGTNSRQCLNCHNNCVNNNYIEQNIPWLYDTIGREEANTMLCKFINVEGVFLVRTSSKNPDNYVLSFVHDRKVKHCHIRKMDVDSTICFSIDDGKMKFYDLKQLVEFYQLNSYFLPTKLRYFLVHSSK